MIYVLFLIIVILAILIKNKKTMLQKLKQFLKDYKILIAIEIIVIAVVLIINIFNKAIVIKEEDPHSNKVLKSTFLKEGERYEYYVMEYIKSESGWGDIQEKVSYVFVKKVGLSKLTIEKDGEELEYNYGEGFTYYGIKSCNCGTPIRFYKTTYEIFKIISLSIIVIDLIIICLVKENKPKGEDR